MRTGIFQNVEQAIGNTPLLKVNKLHDGAASAYVKLEQANPGGSIKDRIAKVMIKEAEKRGDLRQGISIVESSSGNTAIGLAMLGALKGYNVYAICDRHVPAGKLCRISTFGGKIVYLPDTPPGFDTVELRIALAERIAATTPNCISLGQFSNPDNPKAHYETTAPEIWDQTNGKVTAIVAAVGTCGTITGIGRYMKERNIMINVHGAEPVGSIIFGGERGNFLIQGGGLSFTPSILDRNVVDVGHKVTDAQAVAAVHRFAFDNGLMVGGTSGLVLHVLYDLAENHLSRNDVIVGILPDGGDRYLDSIYHVEWLRHNKFGESYSRSVFGSPLFEQVSNFGCSINGWDPSHNHNIRNLYHQLKLPVPNLL